MCPIIHVGGNSYAARMPVFDMKITEIFSAIFPKIRKDPIHKPVSLKRTDSALLKRPDEVKLAEEAKFIANLRAEMNKSNASREEKLTEIKRRLDEGTYKVNSDELARKILGD